jgi:hypothetical protein
MDPLRASLVVVPLACNGCGSGECSTPHGYRTVQQYRRAELATRTGMAQPVIDALERHRSLHGRYPESLDALLAGGLI